MVSRSQGLRRYRHVRELQAGSTAMVHLVEDMCSGKPYAIKLLQRSGCDLGTAREVGLRGSCRRWQVASTACRSTRRNPSQELSEHDFARCSSFPRFMPIQGER